MSEWQPIETMPKNQWLLVASASQFVGGQLKMDMAFFDERENFPYDTDCFPLYDATHWMPLPEPPQ